MSDYITHKEVKTKMDDVKFYQVSWDFCNKKIAFYFDTPRDQFVTDRKTYRPQYFVFDADHPDTIEFYQKYKDDYIKSLTTSHEEELVGKTYEEQACLKQDFKMSLIRYEITNPEYFYKEILAMFPSEYYEYKDFIQCWKNNCQCINKYQDKRNLVEDGTCKYLIIDTEDPNFEETVRNTFCDFCSNHIIFEKNYKKEFPEKTPNFNEVIYFALTRAIDSYMYDNPAEFGLKVDEDGYLVDSEE